MIDAHSFEAALSLHVALLTAFSLPDALEEGEASNVVPFVQASA